MPLEQGDLQEPENPLVTDNPKEPEDPQEEPEEPIELSNFLEKMKMFARLLLSTFDHGSDIAGNR